jgi:hypothetical protein
VKRLVGCNLLRRTEGAPDLGGAPSGREHNFDLSRSCAKPCIWLFSFCAFSAKTICGAKTTPTFIARGRGSRIVGAAKVPNLEQTQTNAAALHSSCTTGRFAHIDFDHDFELVKPIAINQRGLYPAVGPIGHTVSLVVGCPASSDISGLCFRARQSKAVSRFRCTLPFA